MFANEFYATRARVARSLCHTSPGHPGVAETNKANKE